MKPAVAVDGRGGPECARDGQETDFARTARGAPPHLPVQHDRRSDAEAEPEQDEGVVVLGGSGPVFGDGGEVGLVLHEHGRGQTLLELADQATVPGGQTGGLPEFSGDRIDQPGRPDADAVQGRRAGLPCHAFQERDGLFDGVVGRGLAADRQGRLGEGHAQQVGDDHGDAVGAYVEGGQMGTVGDDAVEPGVGSATLGAGLADHPDQPRSLQPFDQVGDRGPGQSGQGLQLRGRQRAVLLEEAQGEPVVDGPGGAR